ncbi:MAG: excinuclease ABC subunit UvrA [Acidobacteriota bacterium]
MALDKIIIRGASQHNLKNIDLEIPRNKLVVITGISGSGKSTLAFDTIYAEGQRRYVESLSAYARQFLEQMEKPEVEHIEGLSPAISIEQRTASKNPRSTVGTVTEIYDYLRLLFARIGKPHCPQCSREIATQTVQQIVDRVMEYPQGEKIQVLAPLVRGRKGEYRKELQQMVKEGFIRARIDGELRMLNEEIKLDKHKKHDIEIVVDRLLVKQGIEARLADSLEVALKLANGVVLVGSEGQGERLFSERLACPHCGTSMPELSPRMFSFNSPHGACPTCGGLGTILDISPQKVIPDELKSVSEGAIQPWGMRDNSSYLFQMLKSLARHYRFDLNSPFHQLPPKAREVILNGSGKEEIQFLYRKGDTHYSFKASFEGVIPNLTRRYRETHSSHVREEIERYMSQRPCPECGGQRLRRESLAVKIAGHNIAYYTSLSVNNAIKVFSNLHIPTRDHFIADRILKEIRERLEFMENVGLGYLELQRSAATLSGGEGQRIRLATQIGSSLMGVVYVLDEPSIGLHQRDNGKLLRTLFRLRDLGNTILVVEHDEQTILSADHIVDLGPGAGVHGGELVFQGTPEEIMKSESSLTGLYLAGKMRIPIPQERRPQKGSFLTIVGAAENNLKEIDVDIPLGVFTVITGVSGSGKSTLIDEILYKSLAQRLYRSPEVPGKHKGLKGVEHIDKVVNIDQSPIGRTPRSNSATYTGVFTFIRELFSRLPEARMRGYKPGRFSFNVKGGRCEACRGDGLIKIEMHFLPDVYITCDVCKGRRFNRETLEVKYKGKSIADVLDMTVDEALELFKNIPAIKHKLQTLADVGLGYIKLGQSATTLSGGEAQRVKLSRELSKKGTGKTLYILDEPTTGLHFDDIKKLLNVLDRLVDKGNTVVVIEHNMEVIKTADHIIDLGPEGGDEGGWIVAQGTPEELAQIPDSYTGIYLRKVLEKKSKPPAPHLH